MKIQLAVSTAACLLCLGLAPRLAAEQEPSSLLRFDDDATGLSILRAEVGLPTPGRWILRPTERSQKSALREVFLTPTADAWAVLSGTRSRQREDQEDLQRSGQPIWMLYHAILNHPARNDGDRPASLEELAEGGFDFSVLEGRVHVFFEEKVSREDQALTNEDARILAFEIAPVVDDGKHWILLTNGRSERRDIDSDLFAEHGVTLVPGRAPWDRMQARQPGEATYLLYARLESTQPSSVEVENALTGDRMIVRIDPGASRQGKHDLLEEWASLRMGSLPRSGGVTDTTILPHWRRQLPALYGTGKAPRHEDPRDWQRPGPSSSIFGVLGGRAAIRETLQTQAIRPTSRQEGRPRVPLANIPGVAIASHPFEEMLGGEEGGRIELADLIPADRLLAYFPQPKGLLEMLDGGADFLFQAGTIATRRSLEHGLADRYLATLSIDRDWMRSLLQSGAIGDVALAAPDLFLIDGTEITAVVRLKIPTLADALLRILGIQDLQDRTTRRGPDGETSHWARRGDFLIMSSDAGELDQVLALHHSGGEGSLGQSAELRYMLTQLPLQDATQAFVYFSDPFIRRLVGPETKIPQYRRLHARGEMEALVAGALLHRLDGHEAPTDVATLVAQKYARAPQVAVDAKLDPQCGALSELFGPLPRMHSLLDLRVQDASPEEAAAYGMYLENYNRFWRRFFDPIALRIDQPTPRNYELSVFILPLVDNSLYDIVRDVLVGSEDDAPLLVPQIEPQPVASLSVNLREEVWVNAGGGFGRRLARQLGIDPSLWDYLGPDLHVSIADGDPILEMGSGDLAQIFGPMVDRDMIMIPAILSMFTRSTALCVGLSDPDRVRRIFDNAVGSDAAIMESEWARGSLYRIAGREGWVYRISFLGLVKLRLSIEIQDRFLVIQNQPLTSRLRIKGVTRAAQPGARLVLSPEACQRQLPALFASAAEHEREAAFSGIGHLHPLLLTLASTIEEASDLHKSFYGFRPVHPAGGSWTWDGRKMISNRYGSTDAPSQPDHQDGDREFGLLRRVDQVEANMRFEDDGLRAVLRWKLRSETDPTADR